MTTTSTAAGSISSTAEARDPSEVATADRRLRSVSAIRTASVSPSAMRCRAARAPTAPAPQMRTFTVDRAID
jgi:hypothetical protein